MISCSTDPLDNEEIWHDLIMGYVNAPMNYGTDIGAVRPLALAAGISPSSGDCQGANVLPPA